MALVQFLFFLYCLMGKLMKLIKISAAAVILAFLAACAPEVGSEAWCAAMKEKPKGDWSSNEATEFAKNCVFK